MKRALIITLFLSGFAFYGQENENVSKEKSNTLQYFNEVCTNKNKSYKYGEKRVIPIVFLDTIAQKIQRDYNNLKNLQAKEHLLKKQQNALTSQIKHIESRLGTLTLLGKRINGQVFVIISFVVFFLLLLFFVFLKFKSKNDAQILISARKALLECEESYKILQRKSMKEKEELARKLQDQILKNKK